MLLESTAQNKAVGLYIAHYTGPEGLKDQGPTSAEPGESILQHNKV